MHELVGQNLRCQEVTGLATEMIPHGFPFKEPIRQIDGSYVVTGVGMSRRDEHRLDAVTIFRIELRRMGKTSQRDKTIPTGALHDPSAQVAGCNLVQRRADQSDLGRCPRARSCESAEFRTLLACAG